MENGEKAFGKGIFSLFSFIQDSIPSKDVTSLRYYNRRSFTIFDKYVVLREVHKELNEQMTQILMGLNQCVEMRSILIKGAVKAFEDAVKKYKSCRSIEQYYKMYDRIDDFFDVVYEKFEK